jgi:hypothetical protein
MSPYSEASKSFAAEVRNEREAKVRLCKLN